MEWRVLTVRVEPLMHGHAVCSLKGRESEVGELAEGWGGVREGRALGA